MTELKLNKGWTVDFDGNKLPASVPGDVTLDLWHNHVIDNPYFGMNHKQLHWIINRDFVYETRFDLSDEMFTNQEILLEFDGIDTYADIYLNGKLLGHTQNMFLKYTYSVRDLVKKSGNLLTVKMLSTGQVMDKIDAKDYYGVFNLKRLFVRKAQCHFGWDWAPDMPGYGICGDVKLIGCVKNRISDVHYRAYNNGKLSLFVDLNYTVREYMTEDKKIRQCDPECANDILRYVVATHPDSPISDGNGVVFETKVTGEKNFANFTIDNPELWWPNGYGKQPLYDYKVQLVRGGKVADERAGRFAFREIALCQEPFDRTRMQYRLQVNGANVFVKGSNWVPAECFIGGIKTEKYLRLIDEAARANFNMLRVWGGGLYEKDVFYDICDSKGIMVWQDLMFACADIPEDDPEFVETCQKEVVYQVCRLRNHPSLVYWCGGNEKTGSYGHKITKGDYFVDVIMRGTVDYYDGTRPYARQSPCSLTDVGNDVTSGESHAGSYESSLFSGVLNYRNNVSMSGVPFVSECANMGPSSMEAYKRMFPTDKLWPMNDYWRDRLMDNPYSVYKMPFCERQLLYADTLYGRSDTLRQFIAKGMTTHAESMRAEIEFARANAACGGFMNWMYSDIWPSATWAVVDYYCEPKQAYYQMKRSYAPVVVTFVQNEQKQLQLVLLVDGLKTVTVDVNYGMRTLDGKTLWQRTATLSAEGGGADTVDVTDEYNAPDSYLFAEYVTDGVKQGTVFSYDMWHTCKFVSDYVYKVDKLPDCYAVTVAAKQFAKGVIVRMKDNYKFTFSDNYVDLQAGEQATLYIYGATDDDIATLEVTDFAKETA